MKISLSQSTYLSQQHNPLPVGPDVVCDVVSNPLLLEILQALNVYLVVGVTHVGHDTTVLHLVEVLAGYHMLCAYNADQEVHICDLP